MTLPVDDGWPGSPALPALQRRVRVALGQEPGDLALNGGQVVNVFTGEVERANVVVADGWIAGVGPYDWPARETVAVDGRVVLPGLIDGHVHVESTLLMPGELARMVVPHGTTALVADPHELGNVCGVAGIDFLLKASEGIPLDVFCMASSCVPATRWDDAGAVLGPDEVAELLRRPRVLGLAEVMDTAAVLRGEPWVLEKIRAALARQRPVDGHAPGMEGRELIAYAAAGMRSDHESTAAAEARAKARLGMMVQVREGSAEHNLEALLPLLAGGQLGDWCLATDDLLPNDLRRLGHIDHLLRRVVAGGVPPARAVRHAALVPARHYGLHDRGAVAPGYRADLFVADDLREFRPHLTVKDGRVVARDGHYLAETGAEPRTHENTVRIAPVAESSLVLRPAGPTFPVIRIVPHQIVTRVEAQTVLCRDGQWVFAPDRDVVLVASVERHRATGRIGLGLVAGFGLRHGGALGSSVAHDAHNLIVAGSNSRDVLVAIQWLAARGGGFVVVAGGEVRAGLPLPVAGLLSDGNADAVCRQLDEVNAAARQLGCPLDGPFGYLSFLALPVIPELRITDQGLYDVNRQQFVNA